MELNNNDRLTIYLHASIMEAMWMDLKMEIAFGVDIQLKIVPKRFTLGPF